MKILVSACLLGLPVRYDGESKPFQKVISLSEKHVLIPVCPEQLGGLPTPRPRAEIRDGKVVDESGHDVTENFKRGARITLEIAKMVKPDLIIFKSRSPSCGIGKIYDGTFSGKLKDGNGITADLLMKYGFEVMSEEDERLDSLLDGLGV